MDPGPRRTRSGPLSRRRPGHRHVPEPANDGRAPGGRRRGRRDRLRPRWHEAGPEEAPQECAADRHPPPEEGTDALGERPDAEHGRPRRRRQAVRPGLPPRRERVQGHLGRQEARDRRAEHPSREARGRRRGRGGRVPEVRARVHESGEVSDDGQRGALPRRARGRREVPRAVSDDARVIDPALDGGARAGPWRRRKAGRGRTCGDEHDRRSGLRRGARDDGDVRRRLQPDGRGDRPGGHDRDPARRGPRAAERAVDRPPDEDGTGGPEPRARRRTGRLAPGDPGTAQPGGMLLAHGAGVQPRGDLPDADHRHLRPLPRRRLPHGGQAGLQRPDRPRDDGGGRRDLEGVSPLPDHGERREPARDPGHEGVPARRGDGRAHGEQRADLGRPRGLAGARRGAPQDAREADAEARRPAEGHPAAGAVGPAERRPDADPLGLDVGTGPRGDPPHRRVRRRQGEQPRVPDGLPVPRRGDGTTPPGREADPRHRGQLHRAVRALDACGDGPQARRLLRQVRRRAVHLAGHRGQDPRGGRMKLEFEMDTYKSEIKPTWCPGCGDFAVLRALQTAIHALQLEPWNVVIVSGGDGDGYGIGVGHFIHAMRRNIDITYLVMNNQIYGLTTGQASPTSEKGMKTKSTPIAGVIENPVDPISLALASGATYVARGFSGDVKGMSELVKNGITHHGFSLIDCMSPCVTYNKVNTYDFFRERVYDLQKEGHDPSDMKTAFAKAIEWPFVQRDRIPLGLFYRTEDVPTYEDLEPALKKGPPVHQPLGVTDADALLDEFL